MTEEAGKVSGIEKFDGTYFAYWRMQIEDYLYGRKLHLPLLGTKPESMKLKEWTLLDRQVLGVIRLTLSRSVAHNIVKEKTTTDLMKALSGMYEKLFVNNKVHLMKKFFNSKMAEMHHWETMRMAVSNSTGKEKLKYNDIRDLILAEEIRRKDAGETSGFGSALNLEIRGRDQANKYNVGTVGKQVTLEVDSPLDDWVLDSGASFHTTSHREIIQNYAAGDFGKMYLVDGSALDVVGLGDIWISLPNGFVWLLEKVQHIPDLRRNLISVGQLDDKGHAILFVGSTWKVTKGARESKKNVSFLKTGRTPKAEKLELVHTDLWEPSSVASLGGSRYYITFIDDSSRKADAVSTATYLINRGSSVPMEFRLPEKVWSGKEDMSTVVSDVTEIDQKKSEFVNLDELTESTVQKRGKEDKENVNSQVDLSTTIAEVRRSSRNIRPPQRYSPVLNYLLLTDGGEPECYDEALQDENSSKWELAMKDEMDSLLGNQTWEPTKLLVGKKALHNKWVYRIKNEHDGRKRYKARLVVKGFQQKEGIDYTKIFSPVVKMSTIRLVLGMVATENLHLEQLDVKTTFLHGSGIEKINNLKKQLSKQFAMKGLGAAKQILGMRIIRDKANGTLKLSRSEYVKKVLSRFNMNEAKPVSTSLGSHFKLSKEQSPKIGEERDHMSKVPYTSAIGSMMYAMVCTRPDIAHAMGVVSRFMSRPGKQHWEAVKWILRYLKGSLDTCLCFTEAEYVAATKAGKEMIWLHGFLDELGWEFGLIPFNYLDAVKIEADRESEGREGAIPDNIRYLRSFMYEGAHQLNKLCMMTTKLQIRKAYSQGSQLLTLRKSTKLKEHLRVGLAISFLETDPCDRLPNSEEAAIGFQQLNLYLKANYRGIKLVGG
ncbi:Retrovirus-related Pol polyprotein from transposon TNT 1-94 [Vitis vinifera]|uniref:Retrovirus-related Pol polyprotein from transposon TNT 1-94 n=2 Tax=Vitis vinifera TaxID=29760 RepID=A0A438GKS0_VITVI|nr:Retrovirus-related Pol polyprotein from transposon TNT 1-94 [Vitis vinifera]